jgi:hypothetical protein
LLQAAPLQAVLFQAVLFQAALFQAVLFQAALFQAVLFQAAGPEIAGRLLRPATISATRAAASGRTLTTSWPAAASTWAAAG